MTDPIDLKDIDSKLHSEIKTQSYDERPLIEGVKIVDVASFVGETGDFSELFRIDDRGELENFPGFKLAQVNRARMFARAIKAWHIHLKQDDIWYVSPTDHLLAGLWDLRENSKTKNQTMKIVLGGGNSRFLFIPRGVAHGATVFLDRPVDLFYLINNKFDVTNPDEKRIRWDYKGKEFWEAEKE